MTRHVDSLYLHQDFLTLCLVTHRQSIPLHEYLQLVTEAVSGGVTLVQMRDKHSSNAEKYEMARALKVVLDSHHIPLVINDDIELAHAVNADGVHLGQSDHPPLYARKRLGQRKLIGLSVSSATEIIQANQLDYIDYVAASAVFTSGTKHDCNILGLELLANMAQQSVHPIVAIGGIKQTNVCDVIRRGAAGVAVVSALHQHPKQSAEKFIHLIKQTKRAQHGSSHISIQSEDKGKTAVSDEH